MPKSLKPRSGARPKGTPSKQALLPRDIEEDVRRTARPTQQDDVLSRQRHGWLATFGRDKR